MAGGIQDRAPGELHFAQIWKGDADQLSNYSNHPLHHFSVPNFSQLHQPSTTSL